MCGSLQGKASGTPALPLSHLRSLPPRSPSQLAPRAQWLPLGALSIHFLPTWTSLSTHSPPANPCPVHPPPPRHVVWHFSPWLHLEFRRELEGWLPCPLADGTEPGWRESSFLGTARGTLPEPEEVLFTHGPQVSPGPVVTWPQTPAPTPLSVSTRPRPGEGRGRLQLWEWTRAGEGKSV